MFSPAQCPAEKSSSELSWAVPTWPVPTLGQAMDSFYVATAFDPRRGTRGFVPRLANLLIQSHQRKDAVYSFLDRQVRILEKDIETGAVVSAELRLEVELVRRAGRTNQQNRQSQDCQA